MECFKVYLKNNKALTSYFCFLATSPFYLSSSPYEAATSILWWKKVKQKMFPIFSFVDKRIWIEAVKSQVLLHCFPVGLFCLLTGQWTVTKDIFD